MQGGNTSSCWSYFFFHFHLFIKKEKRWFWAKPKIELWHFQWNQALNIDRIFISVLLFCGNVFLSIYVSWFFSFSSSFISNDFFFYLFNTYSSRFIWLYTHKLFDSHFEFFYVEKHVGKACIYNFFLVKNNIWLAGQITSLCYAKLSIISLSSTLD